MNQFQGSRPAYLPSRRDFLRRTGMGLVNRSGPLKRDLILRAMGLSGDLPDRVLANGGQA